MSLSRPHLCFPFPPSSPRSLHTDASSSSSDQACARAMAMELPLFLGDGPDAALFSSLWSSFPDDLQQPPQEVVLFLFFSFSLANHQSLSRLLPVPPPPPHFPVLLLGRQPAAATGWVDVDAAWPPQGISSPCTARVTFTTASYRYRGQGGLGRRAAN